jgi:hypothetical protein
MSYWSPIESQDTSWLLAGPLPMPIGVKDITALGVDSVIWDYGKGAVAGFAHAARRARPSPMF